MYSTMVAFCLAGVMLCIGILIRGKVRVFQSMLIPACVIGGVIGFVVVNLYLFIVNNYFENFSFYGVTTTDFSNIVDVFFVLSFISIGLTGVNRDSETSGESEVSSAVAAETDGQKKKKNRKRRRQGGIFSGAFGMAMIWCALFSLTALVGALVLYVIGPLFDMDPIYGFMIPFAFCQGPGQAHTYGALFENTYGYANAEMVALTFSAVGFLAAFLVGVPLARYGLRKKLGKYQSEINDVVRKGYYRPEEQKGSLGKETFQSANVETVAAHLAIMGVTYLLALGLAYLVSLVPGIGSTFSAMLFMWGQIAALIVRSVMKKLNIDYLLDSHFLSRVTSCLTDFLIVSAFMAISIGVILKWLAPILILAVIATVITFFYCLYFGSRLGSDHDFERTLGVYGACTGTIPSGISLLRIVDQKLETPTGAELGIMNALLVINTVGMLGITFCGLGYISLPVCLVLLAASIIIYWILAKVFGGWIKKPTFSLKNGRLQNVGASVSAAENFVSGKADDVLDHARAHENT